MTSPLARTSQAAGPSPNGPSPGRYLATGSPRKRKQQEPLAQRAAALGLCIPLGPTQADQWAGESEDNGRQRERGQQVVENLRQRCSARTATVIESARVRCALDRFETFLQDTQRVPFVDPKGAGGMQYNQETLNLFREHIRQAGSVQQKRLGTNLRADTIDGMVSAVRLMREDYLGEAIAPHASRLSSAQTKHMRSEDGPKGARRESRAWRAHHFRELIAQGYDRTSMRGMVEWAAAMLAHNLVLRAGEIGCPYENEFDTSANMTWASIDWRKPCSESRGLPWCMVLVAPCKFQNGQPTRVPMPVRARADTHTQQGAAMCAYTSLKRMWDACIHTIPISQRTYGQPSTTPLFTDSDGMPWTSKTTSLLAVKMGAAIGIPSTQLGGKTFRIGGATEICACLGEETGRCLLKKRGRWSSDIAFIYQRALLAPQLDASGHMGDEGGSKDMEESELGWVQPASFR